MAIALAAQLTCTYGSSLSPNMFVTVNASVTNLNISYSYGYTAPPMQFVNFSSWHVSLPYQPWPGVGTLSSYTNVSVYSADTIQGQPPVL